MRILQVISYLYPAWSYGGPGKLVYDLSSALAKRGHQVTVYSTDAFDATKRREAETSPFPKSNNLKAYFFKNISNRLAYQYKFFLPKEGYSFIKKEISSYDVIHAHEFFTPLTIATSYFAQKSKVPFIISAHGTLDAFHIKHRSWIKQGFMYMFGKKILRDASAFIAATKEEVEEYRILDIDKEKISLVRNGVNTPEFMRIPQKGRFRKKYNIPSNAKILLYIGRINKLKGLDMLVKGFEKLIKDMPCILIIAGSDDGYLDEIKKQVHDLNISQHVIFPGKLFGKAKLEAFADSDIFVYPSPAEGFSIAILEAAASGLPLLITEGCKFPEVKKYQAGLIIPYESEALTEGINKLFANASFVKQAGKNARKLVQDQFTIERMVDKLEEVYKHISAGMSLMTRSETVRE